TRLTESLEEAQDTSSVRRVRERAASLGATTVTVLAGSPAAAPEVADYPGQRQICTVRTAGTAASPTTYITNPAAYTRVNLLRPGETLSACGAYFRGGTPATLAPGVAHTMTLAAMDRYGNLRAVLDSVQLERVSGPTATFGPRTALVGGQAGISVTFGGYGTSVLRAAGRRHREEHPVEVGATTVAAHAGSWQAAMAGTAVPARPAVVVRDGGGNAVAGRTVTFSVGSGGGSVAGGVATTDAAGVATVGDWFLGPAADLNTLTATVSGAGVTGSPVTFSAAGCAGGGGTGYAITLCFSSAVTATQRAAFEAAAARWQGLVTGDLADMAVDQEAGFCGGDAPALDLVVDDLLIFASITALDGPGGTLGSAGPCRIRSPGSLSFVGRMRFDGADLESVEAGGRLQPLILHEMGHVLGIGSLWPYFSLLQNPSSAGSPLDTYYSGSSGIAGFNAIGGSTYTGGLKVPVENTGGSGTMNGHWRESVLANELMTGWLGTGTTPLSQLTVRSLADMGYTVNAAGADPFFLTLSVRSGDDEPGLQLVDDIWTGPIYRVDAQGRATLLR
ncbi:MAG TPA: leishmanolysin-related zinc metalloendopeptidase, partial [Longimicrobium sp.]|nr:leishmanolysin-related zinc metalloendopeptidase [Longimicrobium sp.]